MSKNRKKRLKKIEIRQKGRKPEKSSNMSKTGKKPSKISKNRLKC